MVRFNRYYNKAFAVSIIALIGIILFMYGIAINSELEKIETADGKIRLTENMIENGKMYSTEEAWRKLGENEIDSDAKEVVYSLLIESEEPERFGIMITDFSPAYELRVNGRLAGKSGLLPETAGSIKARYKQEIIGINMNDYVKGDEAYEIEIEVESMATETINPRFGNLVLGKVETLHKSVNTMVGLNLFAMGVFLTLFIFSIFLYFGGNRETYLIFFAVTNLVSFIKSLFNSNPSLAAGIIDMDYMLMRQIDFSTAIINTVLVLFLYNAIYPGYLSRKTMKVMSAASLLLIAGSLFLSYGVVIRRIWPLFILVWLVTFTFCIYINMKAVMDGGKHPLMLLAGFMFYAVSSVLVILNVVKVLPNGMIYMYFNPAQYGSMIFFIVFSIVIAEMYAKRFKETGFLYDQLADINENLENIIEDKTSKLRALNQKLKVQAETDGLTGLMNHNTVIKVLGNEIERAKRYEREMSILMMDVDHFRRINSLYGHIEGDRVLAGISETLSSCLRQTDIIGRYGGEEILIVLPDTPASEAVITAERLRRKVEDVDVGLKNERVTISIGVAWLREDDDALKIIDRADCRLYEAKRSGRNKVS